VDDLVHRLDQCLRFEGAECSVLARLVGEGDGGGSGGSCRLNVGAGVSDEDGVGGTGPALVEGPTEQIGLRLEVLLPRPRPPDDTVDLAAQRVGFDERPDGLLGVVADDGDGVPAVPQCLDRG
jgi:hypothetical protein